MWGPAGVFFDTCYSGKILKGAKGSDFQPNVDKFANDPKSSVVWDSRVHVVDWR
jgi:hypothetical protein